MSQNPTPKHDTRPQPKPENTSTPKVVPNNYPKPIPPKPEEAYKSFPPPRKDNKDKSGR